MKFPPFEIENFFRQHEFSAPHGISSSDCEPLTMPEVLELASPARRAQFENLWLGYTESQGHPELRSAIADLHDESISADHVMEVVPEEGIFVPMNALLNEGDHVIAIFPSFQSLYDIGRVIGCDVSFWRARCDETGWTFDVDELESLVQPNTSMLIINFPHNPSGALLERAELERIVDLARRHGLILYSDEIYRFAEHDLATRLPSACELYDKAVVLGGLSKCFGLPGLRVGWLITRDAALMHDLREMKSYTTICGSAPSEILALIALENTETLIKRCVAIVRENTAVARSFFDRHDDVFSIHYPQAGTVGLVELTADMDVSEFADGAVREAGVMVLPAKVMKFEGNYFRIGLGRRALPHALESFEQYVLDTLH